MSRAASLCAVILAAGESSRMGRDKALLPWPPEGSTVAVAGLPGQGLRVEIDAVAYIP